VEDILNVIYTRRSVREFTEEPVTDEQVEIVLKAAMAAPSALDLRPWHFIAVRKRKLLDKLADVHKYAHPLEEAPVAIIVCGDQEVSERHWVEDTCVATQNLLLAATALGLGGVWISLYPKNKHQEYVRELLNIPKHVGVLCAVALGHPTEQLEETAPYDPERIHWEKW